jgi:PAS domain S-box-containing protein
VGRPPGNRHAARRRVQRAAQERGAVLCLGFLAILGAGDYFTGDGFIVLLYLLPVALGAWLVGRSFGLALAVVAATLSFAADLPALLVAKHVGELGFFGAGALLVSRLKERESAERAARQILEDIVNAVPVRVFWKDKNLVYLGCNAAFAHDAGFADPKDIVGKDDYQMGWRDQAELYRADDRQVIDSGRAKLLIEEAQTRPDGSSITLLTSKVPLLSLAGEVSGVIGTYMDISDRKRAEESSIRLATAVEQAAEAIMITDASGSIVYVNPAFERRTGYTSKEAIGQNPRFLKSGRQDDEFYRHMWRVLASGGVWRGDFVNKRKDGTLFEEHAAISGVRDSSGRVTSYVAVKHDITNERLLQQQLFRSQKMEAVGTLAAGVAHDFNNLLGVIKGHGELMGRHFPEAHPARGRLDEILKAADRAAALTHQLLAFSRKQVLNPRVLQLNGVVSDVQKMLARLIGEDVALVMRLDPGLGSVRADAGQISQVIMNLAVNARDAMPDGGTLTIETSNAELDDAYAARHSPVKAGRYVLLAVSDTGHGMDAEVQAHLFEPFFTTKEPGKGTGLGLSTAYGIVKQSDGYIWVYSEVGVGTTFKVYLPRVDAEPEAKPKEEAVPLAPGSETVLLVEDDQGLRKLLRETLEANGYTVLVARDAREAVGAAAAHDGPIQLLVTDVIMPGLSGSKLADEMVRTRPEVKVLYISGYMEEAVVTHGAFGPGTAFLAKPFSSKALLQKIAELLGRERSPFRSP